MAVFLSGIVLSRVIYQLVENFMRGVAVLTLAGLLAACANSEVLAALPSFLKGLLMPVYPPPRPWEPDDATKLLTAVTFAGLGGFWTLFYSYWMRDKGAGMARYMGRLTGPISGAPETIPSSGYVPAEDRGVPNAGPWRRYLLCDVALGVGGNLLTTLMTCLLAYALLFPTGLLPEGYNLAVVQSQFFEASWGTAGRVLFLVVAAAFLSDTWLATVDAVSRIHTDCLYAFFPGSRSVAIRTWYMIFVFLLTGTTALTMGLAEPGPLILTSAVIGFIGTVMFSAGLILLNHVYLPRHLPACMRPGRVSLVLATLVAIAYGALAIAYALTITGVL
jgi:hypothetical protein